MRACVHYCVHVYMHACVDGCVHVCVCVHACMHGCEHVPNRNYTYLSTKIPKPIYRSLVSNARLFSASPVLTAINEAIADFNTYSCIRWIPRDPAKHDNYVDFQSAGG